MKKLPRNLASQAYATQAKQGFAPTRTLHREQPNRSPNSQEPPEAFRDFTASQLYCPKCNIAQPVRERLLLVLADGDLYEYTCQKCGTSLGTRKA